MNQAGQGQRLSETVMFVSVSRISDNEYKIERNDDRNFQFYSDHVKYHL